MPIYAVYSVLSLFCFCHFNLLLISYSLILSLSLSLSSNHLSSIISEVLKGLQSLNRPYKYIATVIIMQKNGAGLVSAASTYWDTTKDGLCRVTWENAAMTTVVTVYGLCLNVDSDHNEETLPQSTD